MIQFSSVAMQEGVVGIPLLSLSKHEYINAGLFTIVLFMCFSQCGTTEEIKGSFSEGPTGGQ